MSDPFCEEWKEVFQGRLILTFFLSRAASFEACDHESVSFCPGLWQNAPKDLDVIANH
jgi:hypothetical protein